MISPSAHWASIYPCVAAVENANLDTLLTWRDHLPAPQTDVERTVRRRLELRAHQLTRAQLQRVDPELAAKVDRVLAKAAQLGIKVGIEVPR